MGNAVTMIHAAAVPTLVKPGHAGILDSRAHASMYQAIDHVRSFDLDLSWSDEDALACSMSSKKHRVKFRQLLRDAGRFTLDITNANPSEVLAAECYQLYRNVQQKALLFNTFPMPDSLREHDALETIATI